MRTSLLRVTAGFAATLAACDQTPPLAREAKKIELVSGMQRDLLQSVEAEKSAVLAITDEESTTFANESKRASGEVERARLELHRLIELDGRPSELSKLAEFDVAWSDLQAVDAKLLTLAVANTNLKASRLHSGDCALAVDQLVDALQAVEAATTDPKVLRELSAASVSALKIQALLPTHIKSPDDAEMSRLEEQMHALGKTVELAFATAKKNAPGAARARAAEGWEAWARYQHLVAEVVRLSRLNTNVTSFDISVHEKRKVTVAALNALAALLTEVQNVPRPAR